MVIEYVAAEPLALLHRTTVLCSDTQSSGSGSKMLCADLIRSGQGMYSGKLSYLAAYTGTGYGDIEKDSATLMKPELMTMASFKGSGFPDSTFNTHLHADTCANGGGGVIKATPNPLDIVLYRRRSFLSVVFTSVFS